MRYCFLFFIISSLFVETAAQTMSEVRSAMQINYFDDVELIQSQAERFRQK